MTQVSPLWALPPNKAWQLSPKNVNDENCQIKKGAFFFIQQNKYEEIGVCSE